tara:strand:+ start:275 stop:466 length:192 start_codon:yes stop_codon:yes gene_type:complete
MLVVEVVQHILELLDLDQEELVVEVMLDQIHLEHQESLELETLVAVVVLPVVLVLVVLVVLGL